MKHFSVLLIISSITLFGACKTSENGESSVEANSSTFMQCSGNKLSAGKGARLNVLKASDGTLAINLIFGTTVSGTKYKATKSGDNSVFPGSYSGVRDSKFKLDLNVSKTKAKNKFIDGYASSLKVNYPDLRQSDGEGNFESQSSDQFVCGTKIADFDS